MSGAVCFGCSKELTPVLGTVRQAHFRHKAELACSRETYLHALGKSAIVNAFKSAQRSGRGYRLTLPAKRICNHWHSELGLTCERQNGEHSYDLTRHFDTIEVEAGIGPFVADVLLTNSKTNDKMLIEIAVTHDCEPVKLDSGLRIVEAKIESESDVQQLQAGLDARRTHIRVYNLKKQPPITKDCAGRCAREISAFHVYQSGKSRIQTGSPSIIAFEKRRPATVYTHLIPDIPHGILTPFFATDGYREEAERAVRAGAKIRCCSLCRYAGSDALEKPVFCKFKRLEVGQNEAATCEAYRPEIN